jgi:predicted transcriptional regulator
MKINFAVTSFWHNLDAMTKTYTYRTDADTLAKLKKLADKEGRSMCKQLDQLINQQYVKRPTTRK